MAAGQEHRNNLHMQPELHNPVELEDINMRMFNPITTPLSFIDIIQNKIERAKHDIQNIHPDEDILNAISNYEDLVEVVLSKIKIDIQFHRATFIRGQIYFSFLKGSNHFANLLCLYISPHIPALIREHIGQDCVRLATFATEIIDGSPISTTASSLVNGNHHKLEPYIEENIDPNDNDQLAIVLAIIEELVECWLAFDSHSLPAIIP
ncbi:hypothetical protein WR25_08658 [Diploscapter pachys]|uniref:Uncharacterized protein n=1 Tax=Diploscapter pachys TaxID=2018661 RepID=A0A2A2LNT4_9BILA|nr:hypothetical protein WR25_08658 [Diploscapter pachys]